MELKMYLRTLARMWPVVLAAFLFTFGATAGFTFTVQPVYQAKATYVLRLGETFQDDRDFVAALDAVSRRTEIATTYAQIANSRQIRRLAGDALSLTAGQTSSVDINSRLVPGTNILEITGQGPDPLLVRDFTNAVGEQTVLYAQNLYPTYALELLDPAVARSTPIQPNRTVNLILGAIAGLVLGSGIAFLAAYLRTPLATSGNFEILDGETGVYNRRYFLLRLSQEMSRAKRNHYPLSIALMNVDNGGVLDDAPVEVRTEALRKVVALLRPFLRDEDILARFDDTVFAILLPDTAGSAAKEAVEALRVRIDRIPLQLEGAGARLTIQGSAGIVSYQGNGVGEDDLLAEAAQALGRAEIATYGKVHLASENGDHRDASGESASGWPAASPGN